MLIVFLRRLYIHTHTQTRHPRSIIRAKTFLPLHRPARVGARSKSSYPIDVRPKNHLAWYVALKPNPLERTIPTSPQVKWKCPPEFSLNPDWKVADGEESQLAAIPPRALTWPRVQCNCHHDSRTPIIPIIPIEEVKTKIPYDTSVTVNTRANSQPPASCPSVAESQNQRVHDKSLPHSLHGQESGDMLITVAAAVTVSAVLQNKKIDINLLIKLLTDPEMIKLLSNPEMTKFLSDPEMIKFLFNPEMMKILSSGDGLTSKSEDEAPPALKPNTCLPSPSLAPASMVDKLANGCSEPVSKAALSDSTPQTVNQSLFLPSSKAETEINKCARKLSGAGSGPHAPKTANQSPLLPCTRAVMHAGSGSRSQKAENQSLLLPCPKAETEINKSASKPGGMRVRSGPSIPKADNQSPLLPCTKAVTEINSYAKKLGAMHAGSVPRTQKASQSSFLSCSKAVTEINKNVNKPGGMHAGSEARSLKTENQSSFLLCSKVVSEINNRAIKLEGMHAGNEPHIVKAENRSSFLSCSKAVTEINKTVGKPGGMRSGSGQCTSKAENQSSFLPSSKVVSEINNCAIKLEGMPAGSGPRSQKAGNRSSKAVTEINKTVHKPGGMHAGSGSYAQKAENQSSSLPCSRAFTEINKTVGKLGGMHAGGGPCTSKAENQSPLLPCSKAVSNTDKDASTLGVILVGSGPNTSTGQKRPSPSPRLNSDRPSKKLTGEPGGPARPCTDQIVREQKVRTLESSTLRANEEMMNMQTKVYGGSDFNGVNHVNSLNPCPLKLNMEAAKKMIDDYGARDVSQVKPMPPPVASPSMKPNQEEIDRVVQKYISVDHGWRKTFVGPSPPVLPLIAPPPTAPPPTAPPPVTNLHAYPNALEPRFNGTGNYHPSFHPMTIPGHQVGLQYHQSLIKRHGEIPNIGQSGNYSQGHNINRRIEMNSKYQRPCMHFSSPAGCRNGSNCLYQHDSSRRWSSGGVAPAAPQWPRR